ncbi:hypothetical protein LAD12857_02490 [Lacrimispora amygdalina]|uniref:Uncharacterized protein n=1 Tax=Lacrimispora amygdalina TaxID=253257 RepID=A0A3E2N6N1_9FIRM|nr:hypothetical protein [Clostridium indicum]RFZ76551.1 hypothetical protein DS742_23135 [Clostridium indicum]
MRNKWNVTVNGINHEISFKTGVFKGKAVVDGVSTPVKNNSMFIRLFDFPINLDGTTVHLTAIGNKIDLAVDGVYVNSKKPYVPFENIPKWAYLLSAILIVGGWASCGLIGMLLGLLSSTLIISRSVTPQRKNLVPFTIGVTAVCIILDLLITFGVVLMTV